MPHKVELTAVLYAASARAIYSVDIHAKSCHNAKTVCYVLLHFCVFLAKLRICLANTQPCVMLLGHIKLSRKDAARTVWDFFFALVCFFFAICFTANPNIYSSDDEDDDDDFSEDEKKSKKLLKAKRLADSDDVSVTILPPRFVVITYWGYYAYTYKCYCFQALLRVIRQRCGNLVTSLNALMIILHVIT